MFLGTVCAQCAGHGTVLPVALTGNGLDEFREDSALAQ